MKFINRYVSELNTAEENLAVAQAIVDNYTDISAGKLMILEIDFGETRGLVSVSIPHWLTQQGIPFRVFIDDVYTGRGDKENG